MTYGLDTTFLVQVDVADHPRHEAARELRDRLLGEGHGFALAPQVIAEYLHIVTDPARFEQPTSMAVALRHTRMWWDAVEVTRVVPGGEAVERLHQLMEQHSLGRKRILDTLLAATYAAAGITVIISSNGRDFRRFFDQVIEV